MSGPEHYAEAEQHLAIANDRASLRWETSEHQAEAALYLAAAQVHATLALAAATAYTAEKDWLGDENRSSGAWVRVIS